MVNSGSAGVCRLLDDCADRECDPAEFKTTRWPFSDRVIEQDRFADRAAAIRQTKFHVVIAQRFRFSRRKSGAIQQRAAGVGGRCRARD